MEQSAVSAIDWVVVGLSGALFFASLAGAVYVAAYGSSKKKPVAAEFNYLWRARFCFQALAAAFAIVQILRLQVFWGPESVWIAGGWYPTALCRVYIAVEYGLLEPALLLLALFACVYSLQIQQLPSTGGDASPPSSPTTRGAKHPNFNIVFFALGFTLPCCTAQLVAALFTRIFDLDYMGVPTFRLMFTPYDTRQVAYCPAGASVSHCAWCVFPLLSTLISAGFAAAFLMALWVVTGRIVAAAINKRLVARVRLLQLLITIPLVISLVCRGVTVVFQPFQLGFELLRLAHVVASLVMVAAMSVLLVVRPVRDARRADDALKALAGLPPGLSMVPALNGGQAPWLAGPGQAAGAAPAGPWGAPAGYGPAGTTPGFGSNASAAATAHGFGAVGFSGAQLAASQSKGEGRGSSRVAALPSIAAAPGAVAAGGAAGSQPPSYHNLNATGESIGAASSHGESAGSKEADAAAQQGSQPAARSLRADGRDGSAPELQPLVQDAR